MSIEKKLSVFLALLFTVVILSKIPEYFFAFKKARLFSNSEISYINGYAKKVRLNNSIYSGYLVDIIYTVNNENYSYSLEINQSEFEKLYSFTEGDNIQLQIVSKNPKFSIYLKREIWKGVAYAVIELFILFICLGYLIHTYFTFKK